MFVTVTGNCTCCPGEAARLTRRKASARFGTCFTVSTMPVWPSAGALLSGGAAVTNSFVSTRANGVGVGAGGTFTATCAGVGVRRGVGCGVGLTVGTDAVIAGRLPSPPGCVMGWLRRPMLRRPGRVLPASVVVFAPVAFVLALLALRVLLEVGMGRGVGLTRAGVGLGVARGASLIRRGCCCCCRPVVRTGVGLGEAAAIEVFAGAVVVRGVGVGRTSGVATGCGATGPRAANSLRAAPNSS